MAAETKGVEEAAQPLLAVRGLTLRYARRRVLRAERSAVTAFHDISLEILVGKTLALVGPSGSGKSSLAVREKSCTWARTSSRLGGKN